MSDKNQMDELFRESFRDYQPDVPPHIWEAIAARKKRRRAFAWKPLALAVLLMGSIAAWWMVNREEETGNGEQGIMNDNVSSRQPSTVNRQPTDGGWQMADGRKENTNKNLSSRQPSTTNRQPNDGREETGNDEQGMMNKEQEITNKNLSSRQPSTINRQPTDGGWQMADGRKEMQNKKQGTEKGEQEITNKNLSSRQPSTVNRQPIDGGWQMADGRKEMQNKEQGTEKGEQEITNKNLSSRQPSTVNRQPTDGGWQMADGRKEVQNKKQGTEKGEQEITNKNLSSRQQPSAISQLNDSGAFNFQPSTFNLSSNQFTHLALIPFTPARQSRELKPIRIPDCPPADNDRAAPQDYWEVYAGPDYAMKQYSSNDPALVDKRKETQSIQWAYSAGARYTRVFSNGISLRAGVNYSQINEKFSYLQDNVVQLIYIISPAGDTTDSYYVRGTRYKNSVNRYRSIDLPVTIGYELGSGRLKANINAGVIINLRSWQSGSTIDQNLLPVNFNASNTVYQYKTNAGLAFTGALSLYYRLNDRMHLLAEPYYRHNLSPISKDAGPVQERFRVMGLRLGLRMDIP